MFIKNNQPNPQTNSNKIQSSSVPLYTTTSTPTKPIKLSIKIYNFCKLIVIFFSNPSKPKSNVSKIHQSIIEVMDITSFRLLNNNRTKFTLRSQEKLYRRSNLKRNFMSLSRKDTGIRVNQSTAKNMAKEFSNIPMVSIMRETGSTTRWMVLAPSTTPPANPITEVNGNWVPSTVEASSTTNNPNPSMETIISEISMKQAKNGEYSREPSKTTKKMVKAS